MDVKYQYLRYSSKPEGIETKLVVGQSDYWYGEGHIRIDGAEISDGGYLCKKDLTPEMRADSQFSVRKTKLTGVELCPECLRLFVISDHPEAVAYRKWMEATKA